MELNNQVVAIFADHNFVMPVHMSSCTQFMLQPNLWIFIDSGFSAN